MKVQAQFFRTITGILSGPDTFDKSRLIMTFSNVLGVTKILCSFRLVLEAKTGKELPEIMATSRLWFLKAFTKQFYFIRSRRQHLQADLLLVQMKKVVSMKYAKPHTFDEEYKSIPT